MSFRAAEVEQFTRLYHAARPTILAQPGCQSVILVQDIERPTVFVTWSVWDDEAALEAYRTSAFFQDFWPNVRALFDAPPRVQTFRPVAPPE